MSSTTMTGKHSCCTIWDWITLRIKEVRLGKSQLSRDMTRVWLIRSSAHMLPKQAQMDSVVKLVYTALERKPHLSNTLFVMLGDHGMTDQGNHGGGSPGEISAAMVFISPKLTSISHGTRSPVPPTRNFEYHSVISQIDFVPTLAGLMGFATPARSLGIFVPEFLDLFDKPKDRLKVLSNNAQQLESLLRSQYDITNISTVSCTEQCSACSDDLSGAVCWLRKFKADRQSQYVLEPKAIEAFKQTTRNVSPNPYTVATANSRRRTRSNVSQ